jgi:hypothetical protein
MAFDETVITITNEDRTLTQVSCLVRPRDSGAGGAVAGMIHAHTSSVVSVFEQLRSRFHRLSGRQAS